jgi:hypothetical protein
LLWKRMIDYGSEVFRQDEGKTSASKIVKYIVDRKKPVTLDIQREMVDQNLELLQTGAGSELASAVEKLIQHYELKLKDLENDLKDAWEKRDQERRSILEEAKEEHQANLLKSQEEIVKLRIGAEELVEHARKKYEDIVREAEISHAHELEKQKVIMHKQFKQNYYKMMSERACVVL